MRYEERKRETRWNNVHERRKRVERRAKERTAVQLSAVVWKDGNRLVFAAALCYCGELRGREKPCSRDRYSQ